MKFIKKIILCSLLFSINSYAETNDGFIYNTYQHFKYSVKNTWLTSTNKDLYLPILTWHNRYTYDEEHIKKYNERPWGVGGGVSKYDQYGNWNGIYLMEFQDSFNKVEPIGGYGWEKIWHPIDKNQNFRLGLGYTAFITARHNWKYIPIPAALPLASIGYKKVDFQATYIPGTHNNGNVLFGWLKFQF